jgi:hypothetical protein
MAWDKEYRATLTFIVDVGIAADEGLCDEHEVNDQDSAEEAAARDAAVDECQKCDNKKMDLAYDQAHDHNINGWSTPHSVDVDEV